MRLAAHAAVAALAGVAIAAVQDAAQVYIVRREPDAFSDSVPRLPRQIARQVLLQRIGADHDSLLDDLPAGIDQEAAVSYIKQLGVTPPPLFIETSSSGRPADQPAQAVLLVEGLTRRDLESLQAAFSAAKRQASFIIRDPPSAKANRHLLDTDLGQAGAVTSECGLDNITPFHEPSCFTDDVFVGTYDAQKVMKLHSPPTSQQYPNLPLAFPSNQDPPRQSETLRSLKANIPLWISLAEQGAMETMLILLPESSRASPLARWTTGAVSKRSAGSESVMVDDPTSIPKKPATGGSGGGDPNFHILAADAGRRAAIPSCFPSLTSCVNVTNNCTGGHGICKDRYAANDGKGSDDAAKRVRADDDKPAVCFACHCMATLNRPEEEGKGLSTTHWGGNACQKIDVSVPFWLITGFTVAIIGALTFAIGLLFSVGQEKLPGVIGAGVSRTK